MRQKFIKSAQTIISKPRQAIARRHPFVVPVATFLILFFVSLVSYVAFGAKTVGPNDVYVVSLYNDGESRIVPTRAKTVGELLGRLGIALAPKDKIEPSLDTPITENNFNVNIYRARLVSIADKDAGKKIELLSAEPTPRLLAKEAGIELYPEDIIEKDKVAFVSPEEALLGGLVEESVVVDRATPITLNLYGKTFEVRTHAKTVEQLLEEHKISADKVSVFPESNSQINQAGVVFVTEPNKQIQLVEETIPPPTEFVDDFNILLGRREIKDAGHPGKKVVIYETAADGTRSVLQEVIVTRPTTKIVARGRKAPVVAGNKVQIMAAAGIAQSEFYAADYIISHESGWRVNALSHNGCAGLGQACPASKLAAVCPAWETDAVCQMKFFNNYAVNRYGSWTRAFEIWQLQRWW